MGMSITYCANQWEKVKIALKVPVLQKEFTYSAYGLEEHFNPFHFEQDLTMFLEEEAGEIRDQEKLKTLDFWTNYYVDETKEVLRNIPAEKEGKSLLEAIEKNYEEGEFIVVGEKAMYLAKGTEEKERTIWKAKEFIDYDEYSDTMWMALGHAKKYGCDLSQAFIYNVDLWEYVEGTESGNRMDRQLTQDTGHLGEEFEKMLRTMTNFDDDEFYEVRKKRFEKFLPVVRAGAKIIYM